MLDCEVAWKHEVLIRISLWKPEILLQSQKKDSEIIRKGNLLLVEVYSIAIKSRYAPKDCGTRTGDRFHQSWWKIACFFSTKCQLLPIDKFGVIRVEKATNFIQNDLQ